MKEGILFTIFTSKMSNECLKEYQCFQAMLFHKISIIRNMNELQPKGLRRIKTHRKEYSTDTISSFQRRKFLQVISADCMLKRPSTAGIKTIVQLKSKEIGHRTTRSVIEAYPTGILERDFNRGNVSNFSRQNGKDVKQRNVPNIIQLSQWTNDLTAKLRGTQTPIKKLLFDSICKENFYN